MNPKSLSFRIKYGSDKQRDEIMEKHKENLHIFKNQFDYATHPLTTEQKSKINSAENRFKRGDANPNWLVAKTTKEPELHEYFLHEGNYDEHLAMNPHISDSHVDAILDGKRIAAHENVTTRKNLSLNQLDRLSKHPDPHVRDRLLDNHRDKLTPEQIKTAQLSGYLEPFNDI